MRTKYPNRRPPRRPAPVGQRHESTRGNLLYGYDYNPSWPSILSVAHDEADGAGLFVITDRPCHLSGAAFGLPLTIRSAGGPPLAVLSAVATAVPIKFRLSMSGPVPRGQAWSWGPPGGSSDLVDPITGHSLNGASGDCADFPGPYVPPPPANVVSSSYGSSGGMGGWASLTFDQPVIYTGGTVDDAITFSASYVATSVSQADPFTLNFQLATAVYTGAPWNVSRQPGWVSTPVAWPQYGTF